MIMFPANHNFHPFVNFFEKTMKEQSVSEEHDDLVDLIVLKLKSELFKAEVKNMSFLLPMVSGQNKLTLFMIPAHKELDVSLLDIDLNSRNVPDRELETISIIFNYCKDGTVHHSVALSQALCSVITSHKNKMKLLIESDFDN